MRPWRVARVGVLAAVMTALLACAGAQAKSPAQCGPTDRPETGLQGQIPIPDRVSGRSVQGYTCNLTEVGFLPDGMVYYMASTSNITPIDLSDPSHPKQLSDPQPLGIHGCSTSEDGNRAYLADIGTGALLVADTSEVQARKPNARIKVI